jgi:hypothetical protein
MSLDCREIAGFFWSQYAFYLDESKAPAIEMDYVPTVWKFDKAKFQYKS